MAIGTFPSYAVVLEIDLDEGLQYLELNNSSPWKGVDKRNVKLTKAIVGIVQVSETVDENSNFLHF